VAGEAIDVPDWEYDHCIAAGWAEHADSPAPPKAVKVPEKAPEPEKPAKAQEGLTPPVTVPEPPDSPEPADADPVTVSRGFTSEEDVPEPPRPSDPKQDWVDYAVICGLDADKAAAMSKADLMSRFGGRL
jgi:hypothetical protein